MARMTQFHKELLVEFIEKNNIMVRRKVSQSVKAHILWEELAKKLTQAGAVNRSGEEWRKAWGELLCRTKKLTGMYMNNKNKERITPLDHRILAAGKGNLETKIFMKENSKKCKTNFQLDGKEINNQLTENTKDEDTNYLYSRASTPIQNGSEMDRADHLSSLEISELYPKWLIDIEKKRTDIELLNAKTAAKNAESAAIQAEALKKLAEAASLQAEAVMKIARVLENNKT